jgi:hypothetical protein
MTLEAESKYARNNLIEVPNKRFNYPPQPEVETFFKSRSEIDSALLLKATVIEIIHSAY